MLQKFTFLLDVLPFLVFQTYFSSPRFDAREGEIFVCRGDSRVTSEIRVRFRILGAEMDSRIEFSSSIEFLFSIECSRLNKLGNRNRHKVYNKWSFISSEVYAEGRGKAGSPVVMLEKSIKVFYFLIFERN